MCKNPICNYEEVARLKPWFVDPSVKLEKNVLKKLHVIAACLLYGTQETPLPLEWQLRKTDQKDKGIGGGAFSWMINEGE